MQSKKLNGVVVIGLGKGKDFLSIGEYKQRIKKLLNMNVFEGTLNIKVNPKQRDLFLALIPPIKMDGFFKDDREYGGLLCYNARIGDINGAIIVPLKSRHGKNIIEFISDKNIKEKLNLKNGDIVVVYKGG